MHKMKFLLSCVKNHHKTMDSHVVCMAAQPGHPSQLRGLIPVTFSRVLTWPSGANSLEYPSPRITRTDSLPLFHLPSQTRPRNSALSYTASSLLQLFLKNIFTQWSTCARTPFSGSSSIKPNLKHGCFFRLQSNLLDALSSIGLVILCRSAVVQW